VNKSAIARVERLAWNTVDRWLEKAGDCGGRFNDEKTTGFRATELQADEIRTIIQGKQQPTWVFAAIEVWSRLWCSTVVGRRSYQNTLALFRDVAERADLEDIPLIATDGFEFYVL
jgi:transposase-like protein